MKIRPLNDRILTKRFAEKDRTGRGLFVPDNAKETPLEALVVSVGSAKTLECGKTLPFSVRPGAQVVSHKHSGSEVKLNREELLSLGRGRNPRDSR